MKNKVQNTHTKRPSRLVVFAAIIGLGLGAMFTSTASAIGDTDPVVELDGTCNLFGPESPSGIWMSITNNDGWDEEYAIGVFDGIYEDDGEPILDEPLEVIFTDVESGDTEWGPILADTLFATIQVMDLDDGGMGADLVFHDTIPVCIIIPDFDFGGEDDEDDDGPGFDFDIPEFDPEPEIPDFEFDPGIDIPDFGFGDEDEGDEPVVVEDDEEEDEGDEDEGDEPVVVEDDEEDEGDEPVVVEGGVEDDEEGDEPVIVEGNAPVIVWENTTNDSSLDNNEGSTPVIEEIGKPAKPKIDPEDPKDTDSSDEIASSEGKSSQGKSGLSILWIILIILGGITTVGTTTRAIQKNNN